TPLSVKIRLGASLAGDFHGKARGYALVRDGVDVTGTLAPAAAAIGDAGATAPAGALLVDLDRGRFALPAGFLAAGSVLTVDYTAEDTAATARTFASISGRMPRMMPAGVNAVLIDTRHPRPDPKTLG